MQGCAEFDRPNDWGDQSKPSDYEAVLLGTRRHRDGNATMSSGSSIQPITIQFLDLHHSAFKTHLHMSHPVSPLEQNECHI